MDESILRIVEMEGIRTKFVLVGGVFDGAIIMNSDKLAKDQRVIVEVVRDDAIRHWFNQRINSWYVIVEFGFRDEGMKTHTHFDLGHGNGHGGATSICQINDVIPQEHASGVVHQSREVQWVTIKGNQVPVNGRHVKCCVVFSGGSGLVKRVGGQCSSEQGWVDGICGK